jgi:hypothetical protein
MRCQGCEKTLNASPQALDAINDFTARLIRIDQGAEAILEAAERWPETPMIRLRPCPGVIRHMMQSQARRLTLRANLDGRWNLMTESISYVSH